MTEHQVRRKDPMWRGRENAAETPSSTPIPVYSMPTSTRSPAWTWESNVLYGAWPTRKKTVFTALSCERTTLVSTRRKMLRPTKMPQAFWKVEVWNTPGVGLEAKPGHSQKALYKQGAIYIPYETSSHGFSEIRVTVKQLETHDGIHSGL